jgi:hypothetical protein
MNVEDSVVKVNPGDGADDVCCVADHRTLDRRRLGERVRTGQFATSAKMSSITGEARYPFPR